MLNRYLICKLKPISRGRFILDNWRLLFNTHRHVRMQVGLLGKHFIENEKRKKKIFIWVGHLWTTITIYSSRGACQPAVTSQSRYPIVHAVLFRADESRRPRQIFHVIGKLQAHLPTTHFVKPIEMPFIEMYSTKIDTISVVKGHYELYNHFDA